MVPALLLLSGRHLPAHLFLQQRQRPLQAVQRLKSGCAAAVAMLTSIPCAADPRGRNFEAVLRHELAKISAFYADKEAELEVHCPSMHQFSNGEPSLSGALVCVRQDPMAVLQHSDAPGLGEAIQQHVGIQL